MSKYQDLIQLAARSISHAVLLEKLDPDTTRFMLWLLDDNNVHQENYLRMLGVAGSIELELELFQKLEKKDIFNILKKPITLLNTYFAFETLSDNLAVGLARNKINDQQYQTQKLVLLEFNKLMIKKIMGEKRSTFELLKPIQDQLKKISVNNQTLAPKQMKIFIRDFKKNKSFQQIEKLEYSFFSILILNISTCLQLLKSLYSSPIYLILKHSLIKRYLSVNKIITQSYYAGYKDLYDWGRHSILTIPTYAYCIGALNTESKNKNFLKIINNGVLYSAMSDGALLTRLLNDIGSSLLKSNQSERNKKYQDFIKILPIKNSENIIDYLQLLSKKKEFQQCLTRIRKDLQNGEYNICLDNLTNEPDITNAFKKFIGNINFYANLYQKTQNDMTKKLGHITDTLKDNQVSLIINNFVKFHEHKYTYDYESTKGDYAITNNLLKKD